MRIAIISDLHDNLANLDICLKWCATNSIEAMICCGDIANSLSLEALAQGFGNKIYLVQGNQELYPEIDLEKYKNLIYLGRYAVTQIDRHVVGICHEPEFIERILATDKPQIIFHGHTHKPWLETRNGVRIINSGTLGGVFSKATFAFWDTNSGKLELKILELL